MARGFRWARYVADDWSVWAATVDADAAEDDNRGWVLDDVTGLYPIPRGWMPRCVVGIDSSGRQQRAIVATVDCDLWTGAATTFQVEANDGSLETVTVTGRLFERSSRRP